MSYRKYRLIPALLAAALAFPAANPAGAQEICRTAISVAGAAGGGASAADEASSGLPDALRSTEQEIRQILLANGFRPGEARLAKPSDFCFEPKSLKSGIRCQVRQAVCVTFRST